MKKRTYQFVAMAMLGCMVLFGCEKENKDKAPALPPMEAFVLEADAFSAAKSTDSYEHFGTAVVAVGYWNLALYTTLAIPVASYAEAFNHDAERLNNTTWKWAYTVEGPDTTYTAELFAEVISDSIYLEMHISQAGGFQDFVWYTGKCDIVRSGGEWTVYTNPETNLPWLEIDWNYDWEAQTFDVRYTNVLEGNEYADSFIEYGITEDPVYDAYYIIYDALEEVDYEINLNIAAHNGRIYYDGVWHCWDTDLKDIVCSE